MWIIYALGASLLWGLTYVLNEQVYKKVSFETSIFLTTLCTAAAMLLLAIYKNSIVQDLRNILSTPKLAFLVLASVLVFILAEICIALSITSKNATLAGLVEISYPVFIALFAFILFKENTINTTTLIGASLIFAGVFTIYHFNQ